MNSKSSSCELILASTSPYRKTLLERLGLGFSCIAPAMDETALPGESAASLTRRLARGKAESVAKNSPEALVIGCDQVAGFHGAILGKPAGKEDAVTMLMQFSGQAVQFLSALCLYRHEPRFCEEITVTTRVSFREFTRQEAERYIELDLPLDCAGAFKSEAGGSVLLSSLESSDPTALIGLPLIALCNMLRKAGISVP